jgi:hypothetical protein
VSAARAHRRQTGVKGVHMSGLRADLEDLRWRLDEGAVQRAYVAIVSYMSCLRARLGSAHKEWSVAGLSRALRHDLLPPGHALAQGSRPEARRGLRLLGDGLDLDDQDSLSKSLEHAAMTLLGDLERFLDAHDPAVV